MKMRIAKKIVTMKSRLWQRPDRLEKARSVLNGKSGWLFLPLENH
jgi:hypothetical protein